MKRVTKENEQQCGELCFSWFVLFLPTNFLTVLTKSKQFITTIKLHIVYT